MQRQIVMFEGTDISDNSGLWETNGTAGGTHELTGISGAWPKGIFSRGPQVPDFTVFNGEVLFEGIGAVDTYGLWVTDGTAADTHDITGISGANSTSGLAPGDMTVFNGKVLFSGIDANNDTGLDTGLWVTDGTAAGTYELTGITGADVTTFYVSDLTVFGEVFPGEVLFNGGGSLWVTNGTAAGTVELTGISGAYLLLFPSDLTVFSSEVLFEGAGASGKAGLWETNGTVSGTHELTGISGANLVAGGLDPRDMTVFTFRSGLFKFVSEVLFQGFDASSNYGLWVTDGTAAGTHELTGINGAYTGGIFADYFSADPDFTVFNGEVLFNGLDVSGSPGLWATNGTAVGTHELLGIANAAAGGINPSYMTVFDGEVLFEGEDASGNFGLWITDGTVSGTHELTGIGGVNLDTGGLGPAYLAAVSLQVPPSEDFNATNTSDVLFRNTTSGDTWFEAISNGAPRTPSPWQEIGGSDTHYAVLGVGDFYGTGASDILFRNSSTGDTWFEAISNGAFAGWHQIGGSDTHYSVAGVGDFSGYGTSDILFRNNSTGDTWFEAISDGAGWNHIGGSDTHYFVVGVGDFFESGVDDILFRNNSTGDTWVEQITNGALAGWDQIGGSDTHYSVAGVGDFYGNGTDDILFRNNSTGDTWFEAITNGVFAGWTQIGGSDTTYSVVGVGDYFGNNTSDILFRNSAGDTWFEAINNGAFAGWNHIGGSNTSYSVPITVGPPALT
jgi:ELWxxDGT repeat protein